MAFAQAADGDVLVLKHRLDDPADRTGPQVVFAVETINAFEDVFLVEAGILERGLLQAAVLDEVGLVLLHEPAVLAGHVVEFRAGIGRSQRDLQREDVQLLREVDGLLHRFLRLDGQAEDEGAVDDDAGLVTGLGESPHLVGGHALLDARQGFVVAGFVADEEEAEAVVLEKLDRVVVEVRPAVAAPGDAEGAELLRDLAGRGAGWP